MAKRQTFESKLKKTQDVSKAVKLIFSYQSKDSGAWRFAEKIVKVPLEGNEAAIVDAEMKSGMDYIQAAKS